MTPKRIVVVDDEENIRTLLERALPPPEFAVTSFGDPRDALMRLHDVAPDVIICDLAMPDMDGRTFFGVVKRSPALRQVPFLFLSGQGTDDDMVDLLDGGADDYIPKPFRLPHLLAKVRAMLRLAGRRRDVIAGTVGEGGVLAILKFCEDHHLTGRLTVEAKGERRWADLAGGEILHAGGSPEREGEDSLDLLLAMDRGSYSVEQKGIDAEALRSATGPGAGREASASSAPAAPVVEEIEFGPANPPPGRLSMVEVRGAQVQVQTEAENRPHFVVTTVLARAGQVIRKIESAWPEPMKRGEQEVARAHIDRQHDRVVTTLRDLAAGRESALAREVDGALLAWAVSFVAEQVRDHLGAVMTTALLRRTFKDAVREQAALKPFRIAEDGRVALPPGEVVAPEAAAAAAGWTASFLKAAGRVSEKTAAIRVRAVTRMMEAELEKAGFYAALAAAGCD